MSSTRIPAELRRLVAARADSICEYCLIAEEDTFFGCEVDHIVSEKHGGVTAEGNLALACFTCNRYKGSDVGSLVNGRLVRFFDPRRDRWAEHFSFDEQDLRITPLGDVVAVTERILRFNDAERSIERKSLYEVGRYPSPAALRRMSTEAQR